MTSQINFNIIDGTFPVAGQDNSSQGFRDNFTNTKNNFEIAYDEISELQAKSILKSPLSNGFFDNNMQGNVITNAKTQGFRDQLYLIGNSVSGSITVDFNTGSYQIMTLAGATTIGSFNNFSQTDGSFARIKLEVTITNIAQTLTLPATVIYGTTSLAGYNSSNRTITFDGPGTYVYEFNTIDGGTTFGVIDVTGAPNTITGGNLYITTGYNGNANAGISMTVANVAGTLVGNIYATNIFANIISTGGTSVSYTGAVIANTLTANTAIYGTLATNAQPNITLVGNLTSLSVTGNANVGNLTVTGLTDMCGGSVYGIQYVSATSGSSTTINNNTGALIIDAGGTLATYTIVMPSAPVNGQAIKIAFGVTVTALTHTVSGGQTINSALTSGSTAGGGEWVYYTSNSTWYRVT